MKRDIISLLSVTSVLLAATCAAAGDIPCDKLSEKIEYYQCKQVRREFKVGIKKNDGAFCAEHKRIMPVDGCVIKGFDGIRNEKIGEEVVQNNYIYAVVPASMTRDQTDKFKWQCEPRINHAGISTTSSIGKMVPGFTVTELVGKDNATRDSMWQESLTKQGKRLLNTWYSSYHHSGGAVVQQRCILYNEATNTVLVDMYGDIHPSQQTEKASADSAAPAKESKPAGGGFLKGLFR